MSVFNAGIVQFDVRLGNRDYNLGHVLGSLDRLASRGAALAVLPEMWSSGFDYENLEQHARDTPRILDVLAERAGSYGMFVVGSLPELTREGVYNTTYTVDGQGCIKAVYRKIHRFFPAGEGAFQGGGVLSPVETPWGTAGALTCYDLRFPEQSRALALGGTRFLVVSAQWPNVRISHWDVLLRARAVENQIFVIASNRCGRDPGLSYGGHSQIVSPWGKVLAKAGKRGALVSGEVDFSLMDEFRKKIPCLEHRVPEAYDIKNNG